MSPSHRRIAAIGLLAVTGVLVAGCGGGGGGEPSTLNVSLGKSAKTFNAPSEAESGLVTVKLSNDGTGTHGVQFIRYTGDHTVADVKKQLAASSNAIPDWIKLPGGINGVPAGETGTATLNLEEGDYLMVDAAALGGPTSAQPAMSPISLSGGGAGGLPGNPAQGAADPVGGDGVQGGISGLGIGKNRPPL